jgi:hypothetical protein
MKTVILALLAFCSTSLAQTKPDAQLPSDVRIYEPRNLTPDRAERVANFVRNLLDRPGLRITWDNFPHAFVMRSGNTQDLDTAEALIKRFDVPETRIELSIHLIRAYPSSTPDGGPPTSPVPADLKSAIDEMKGAFNYDHYGLWDTIVLPIKSNGEVQGILPGNSSVYNVFYATFGPPTESKTLNLSSFQFSIKFAEIESHIKTDLTIREGQKLVLGKIRLLGTTTDLFLVLTTKVY